MNESIKHIRATKRTVVINRSVWRVCILAKVLLVLHWRFWQVLIAIAWIGKQDSPQFLRKMHIFVPDFRFNATKLMLRVMHAASWNSNPKDAYCISVLWETSSFSMVMPISLLATLAKKSGQLHNNTPRAIMQYNISICFLRLNFNKANQIELTQFPIFLHLYDYDANGAFWCVAWENNSKPGVKEVKVQDNFRAH